MDLFVIVIDGELYFDVYCVVCVGVFVGDGDVVECSIIDRDSWVFIVKLCNIDVVVVLNEIDIYGGDVGFWKSRYMECVWGVMECYCECRFIERLNVCRYWL